jgi:hypothetical protein
MDSHRMGSHGGRELVGSVGGIGSCGCAPAQVPPPAYEPPAPKPVTTKPAQHHVDTGTQVAGEHGNTATDQTAQVSQGVIGSLQLPTSISGSIGVLDVKVVSVIGESEDRQRAENLAAILSQRHGILFGVVKRTDGKGYEVVGLSFSDDSPVPTTAAKYFVPGKVGQIGVPSPLLSLADGKGIDRVDQMTLGADQAAAGAAAATEAPPADPPAEEAPADPGPPQNLQGPNDDRDNIARGFAAGEVSRDEAAEFLRATGASDDEIKTALGS